MRCVFFLLLAMTCGCQKADPKSPEGAFARIATCIDEADAACLYNHLDRDSRWSLQTVHRILTDARGLVEKTYPDDAKKEAFGTWRQEASAADPAALFAAYCEKKQCLQRIAKTFGAIGETVKTDTEHVLLKTTRGGTFQMFYAEDRWGLTLFQEELQSVKLRIQDRDAQIRKNAAQFEEQRKAGTLQE